MSGPAPFGTTWRDGKLVPKPAEGAVVEALVEAFLASGGRIKATAAAMNAKGSRTRRGPWTDVAAARVLGLDCLRDLIPESLWRRCEGLLAERGAQGRRSAHPLGSVVRCRCGGKMYLRGQGHSGRFVCQECRSKVSYGVLEQKFLESLGSVVLSSQEVVAELRDDPRAAEVVRTIGGREVSVDEVWLALEESEQRQLVDVLVDRLEVYEDQIRVVLAVSDRFQAETEAAARDSSTCPHDLSTPGENATSQETSNSGGSAVLLSADEAARLLRTTRRAVYVMADRGALPGVTRIGRRFLIRREDLVRWLDESRAPSPTEDRR